MSDRLFATTIVIMVVVLSAYLMMSYLATTEPFTCFEDEVYAVQIDTDPSNGLTWKCENVEESAAFTPSG